MPPLDLSQFGPQGFDPRTVDPAQFTSIPLGDYKCVIVDSEPTANSAGTGGFLKLDIQIIEGQYSGSIVNDRLNLFHSSDQTVAIAKKRLSAYAHVTGLGAQPLQNSGQLHNRPFIATIGPQKEPNSQYTEIKVLKDLNGNIPSKSNANPVAAAQPQFPPAQAVQQPAQPVQPVQPVAAQPTAWTPPGYQPTQAQQPAVAASPAAPWVNPAPPVSKPPWG
jgi:hypothetical protein